MPIKLKNNVVGYLATAISASDTGLVLQSGNGASFPTLGTADYFYATLISTGGTQEVVKVTARVGDTMTVVRAQEGSSAAGFAVGTRVEMRVTAQSVLDVGRDYVSVKDFGAVGDGVTDDTAAIQAALNFGGYICGQRGDIYKVTTELAVKSNTIFDFRGATLRRAWAGGWLIRNTSAYTTHNDTRIEIYNLNVEDDGTVATRGNFIMMAGVNGVVIKNYRCRASAPLVTVPSNISAYGMYITGQNILIDGVDIDNSACGFYGDGIHLDWVENFTLTNFSIRAGDDALGLFFFPANYTINYANAPARNITISGGFVSSSIAHGIRLGAWGAVSGGVSAEPQCVWQQVLIDGVNFGPCGEAPVSLFDDRTTLEITGKNDRIILSNLNLGTQSNTRLILVSGNPDVENAANWTQHNFGRIDFRSMVGTQTSGQLARMGGADIIDCFDLTLVRDLTAPSSTSAVQLFQNTGVTMRDTTFSTDDSGVAVNVSYVNNLNLFDPTIGGIASFATIQIIPNTDVAQSFRCFGGRIADAVRCFFKTAASGDIANFIVSGTYITGSTLITNITSVTGDYCFTAANFQNALNPTFETADFTLTPGVDFVTVNKPASPCVVTLPTGPQFKGRRLRLRTVAAQTVVSSASNVQPRVGGAADTAILPATPGAWADLFCDNTIWIITASS